MNMKTFDTVWDMYSHIWAFEGQKEEFYVKIRQPSTLEKPFVRVGNLLDFTSVVLGIVNVFSWIGNELLKAFFVLVELLGQSQHLDPKDQEVALGFPLHQFICPLPPPNFRPSQMSLDKSTLSWSLEPERNENASASQRRRRRWRRSWKSKASSSSRPSEPAAARLPLRVPTQLFLLFTRQPLL